MAERVVGVSTAVVEANFDYTYVRIHTGAGLYGTGECFSAPALVPMLEELGELLVGADPRQVVPLTYRLRHALSGTGSFSAAGIAYNALSGMEAALWDLAGKLDGRPVVELLGGRFVDEVPVYADCHGGGKLESISPLLRYRVPAWASESGETEYGELVFEAAEPDVLEVERWVRRAEEVVAQGFRILKFDLDVFDSSRSAHDMRTTAAETTAIAERCMQLRTALGPGVDLAFDCHWRFDVPTAIAVVQALEPVAPIWVEDVVPPDPKALAAVNKVSPVPLATGENTYLVEGFRELLEQGSVSVVTPDAQKAGGLNETKRILDYARLSFLQAAPHCVSSPLGLMATAHASAAAPNVLCIEFHGLDVPFWHDLVDHPTIEQGRVRVPDRPGLGVELNEDVVRAYSRKNQPVFELRA